MTTDVLGPGWTARTLPLRPDDEGEVVATLVRREPRDDDPRPDVPDTRRRAVLYLHGFVDYFFQAHVGDAWAAHGYDFYALDLRKYGRSLRPHQTPNYVTDLRAYTEELDEATRIVREEDGHDVLVVLGHSTGGLVAPLWAHGLFLAADAGNPAGRPAPPDALVLNSPWLELNRNRFQRDVLTPVLDVVGRFAPRLVVGHLVVHYGQSLHAESGGEWTYDLAWKPHEGFPALAGWSRTIRRGHASVARGLDVRCPVLVLASTASGPADRWHEDLGTTDSVLRVEDIVERAPLLGPDVTVVQIPGGVHDLALSGPEARQRYLDETFAWVAARVR